MSDSLPTSMAAARSRAGSDASQTRNVTAGLRRRGFTEAQIAQLWSGNLLRVWRDVERVAQASKVSQQRNLRCDLRCGDGRVPPAGHGAGRGRRRQGDLHAHRRRTRFRRRSGDRCGHAVQDRLEHEGDDDRPARAPRGCRQAPVGRPCRQIPAAVQDERPVDHARDARARSAHSQQRTARRRRRSHAVAGA